MDTGVQEETIPHLWELGIQAASKECVRGWLDGNSAPALLIEASIAGCQDGTDVGQTPAVGNRTVLKL